MAIHLKMRTRLFFFMRMLGYKVNATFIMAGIILPGGQSCTIDAVFFLFGAYLLHLYYLEGIQLILPGVGDTSSWMLEWQM